MKPSTAISTARLWAFDINKLWPVPLGLKSSGSEQIEHKEVLMQLGKAFTLAGG